ncbi:MAG: 4Fe-4S binding protein [Bacillota bacterium]|jgi:pyruvate ferredoxin oxidoreductase delta subunit|nr:4Fe-4S binding protein [Candidatus Fermentithermobacillaceae bacterium]
MTNLKGYKDIPIGGMITEAGNSEKYKTGDWRSLKPIWNEEGCVHCLMCWVFCPDTAIIVEDGKMKGINYDHCKGCGICARECPRKEKALYMVKEE